MTALAILLVMLATACSTSTQLHDVVMVIPTCTGRHALAVSARTWAPKELKRVIVSNVTKARAAALSKENAQFNEVRQGAMHMHNA